MRGRHLNLAARPFVNNRPVTRLTVVLWTAAAAFLIADALLFWGYWRGREDQRLQLTQVESEIAAERRTIGRLDGELAAVDVAQLNLRTELLNEKIAERTFAWGRLFDHLAAILPNDVRLLSLSPQQLAEPRRGGRRRRGGAPGADSGGAGAGERVRLEIIGAARRDDAILDLLDALFADPAFEEPNLARESKEGAEVRFSLSAVYLPAVAATEDRASAAGGDEGGTGDATAPPAGGTPAAADLDQIPRRRS
jgi:Tfp pilus assembly protein PilN